MSIQSILSNHAIDMLPKIKDLITSKSDQARSNLVSITLRACMNSRISLDDMNESQKEEFQNNLIETFKFKELI